MATNTRFDCYRQMAPLIELIYFDAILTCIINATYVCMCFGGYQKSYYHNTILCKIKKDPKKEKSSPRPNVLYLVTYACFSCYTEINTNPVLNVNSCLLCSRESNKRLRRTTQPG